MSVKPPWLIITAFALIINNSYGQGISSDSLSSHKATDLAIDFYTRTVADQAEVYNGVAYEVQPQAYKGSVYFLNKNYCTPGLVRYNGILYKNIPVMYDIYSDVMIAASPNSFNYILQPEKVSEIFISDHHFVYVNDESIGLLKPGFYDELYGGKTAVIVKRKKAVTNYASSQGFETTYTDESDIYIKKDGKYYHVNSKSSVIDILKDKKKELKQYLSSNKIRYNRNKEASVAGMARYYDQITK